MEYHPGPISKTQDRSSEEKIIKKFGVIRGERERHPEFVASHIRRRRCLRPPTPPGRLPLPRRPRSHPSSPRSSTTSSRTPSFPSGYRFTPALPRLASPRLVAHRLTSLACRWGRSGPAAATAAPPIGSRSPSLSASTTSTVTHPRSKRSNGTRVWNCSSDSATAGDFVYNALSPKVAPDVVFGPEDERFQPLVDYAVAGNGDKSCLARWDCRAPEGLLALVQELR